MNLGWCIQAVGSALPWRSRCETRWTSPATAYAVAPYPSIALVWFYRSSKLCVVRFARALICMRFGSYSCREPTPQLGHSTSIEAVCSSSGSCIAQLSCNAVSRGTSEPAVCFLHGSCVPHAHVAVAKRITDARGQYASINYNESILSHDSRHAECAVAHHRSLVQCYTLRQPIRSRSNAISVYLQHDE